VNELTETEHYFTILRDHGCRITPVVISVVNQFYKTGVVTTPQKLREEISAQLGYAIGFPTIYRVLERLLQSGILRNMHRPDGIMRYYLCRNPDGEDHQHFICSRCMEVQEVTMSHSAELEMYVKNNLNATVNCQFTQLEGLCQKCKQGDTREGAF
jgi:Fe2+ or Zn2+ uptake regulation protein